jgi:gamma-glutamyltranspeptidase / glutathione hydrolase
MTLADLKAYRAIWPEPLRTSYHGYQVYALGRPSLGGVNTIDTLNLLEAADLKRHGHYTTSPDALYEFIQICRTSYLLSYRMDVLKKHLPELDLSTESRGKKESARLLWQKMHEPVWQKVLSATGLKGTGNNHSAGVVTVDERGNVAALLHSINGSLWGDTGIFVDGISIPDSASIQQWWISKLKPGDRLPEPTYPLIVLKNDKPYLASSCVGRATHTVTINNLVNILDFGMDPKKSIGTPNFFGPLWSSNELNKEALVEGDFAENLVQAVIAKGQEIKLLSKSESWPQRGFWVAIQIDPKTGNRIGVSPSLFGYAAGY